MHSFPLEDAKRSIMAPDKATNVQIDTVQNQPKRQDEQEFAKMNAEHLLFSEDAVRLFRQILEEDEKVSDYAIHVEHFESLHPHNATAKIVKGIPNGFSA